MALFYVDNVNGNDGNAGTSEALAKATLAAGIALLAAGDTLYIQAGANYSHAATVTINKKGDTSAGRVTIEGYTTVPGARDGRPVITSATNSVPILTLSDADYVTLRHLNITHTAAARGDGIDGASTVSERVRIEDCVIDGCQIGLDDGFGWPKVTLYATEIKNCVGTAVFLTDAGDANIFGCHIHDNGADGIRCEFANAADSIAIESSVIEGNVSAGIIFTYSVAQSITVIRSNTIRENGSYGVRFNHASNVPNLAFDNNIIYGNGAFGVSVACTAAEIGGRLMSNSYNAYGDNTSGARETIPAGLGDITLTADPFTSASDSSLNNTAGGGTLVRNTGFPGVIPGNATAGYKDVGALRHQDAGGAGPTGGSQLYRVAGS